MYSNQDIFNGLVQPKQIEFARRVDSFIIHVDRSGEQVKGREVEVKKPKRYVGKVQFQRPILAIQTEAEQLFATDSIAGLSTIKYPEKKSRGIVESSYAPDEIVLSADRKTLELNMSVGNIDQLRIFVEANPTLK